MPGEHNSSNARHRMEARLTSLQGSTDNSGLLAMQSAVAQARNGANGTAVQALSYRDGLLELQVTAPGADALDHISQQLRTGGWQADLTSGTSSSGSYQGPHPDETGKLTVDTLLSWFRTQSPRDQRVAAGGAVIVLIVLIFGIFVPLDTSVARAHARVQHKESDLAWMRSVAPTNWRPPAPPSWRRLHNAH